MMKVMGELTKERFRSLFQPLFQPLFEPLFLRHPVLVRMMDSVDFFSLTLNSRKTALVCHRGNRARRLHRGHGCACCGEEGKREGWGESGRAAPGAASPGNCVCRGP